LIKPNSKIEVGSRVRLNPGITKFHYETTPLFSLEYVLKKLQQNQIVGIVIRVDNSTEALGVQFPNMKDILWFKSFELENTNYAAAFKQISRK
jgi:hypothetical protein